MPSGATAISARSSHAATATPSTPPADRDERALDQQLAGQPRAPAAERGAHRQLVLPRGAARHQQVRDVDARDQQQAADRAEQREQRQPDVVDQAIGQPIRPGR